MAAKPLMKMVALTDIDEGTRARKDYKNLGELAKSIQEKELIHPIAIAKSDGEKPYVLIAGGRRFRAHQLLERTEIMCRIYNKNLSDLELRSIELEENIQREDLGWQEKAFLEREIHRLQVEIHGEKVSKKPDAPGHSLNDTASMLGVSRGKVSQDISLANAVEMFPDAGWERCKTANDAQKLKRRMETSIRNDHLAGEAQKTMGTGSQKVLKLAEAYIVGDFFKKIKEIPDNIYDLIEMDPPYAIDLQNAKAKRGIGVDGLDEYNEVEKQDYLKFLADAFKECYRVLKPDGYIICWFGPDPWFEMIASIMEGVGFRVPRIPGLWIKPTGQTNSPTTRLASCYEMFFYGAKGSPQLNRPGSKNLLAFSPVPPDKKIHPTQRPIEMIKELLDIFVRPNSNILVPFAGSGATLIAAAEANMKAIGFDLEKSYRDKYILNLKAMYPTE